MTSMYAFSSADITALYKTRASKMNVFSVDDVNVLSKTRMIFIPEVSSETFLKNDNRSLADFSFITDDYFATPLTYFPTKYNIKTERILVSSRYMSETKDYIRSSLDKAILADERVLFVAHSLSGIALLEFLIENQKYFSRMKGNVFLQSPLLGTPIAQIYRNNHYNIKKKSV